MYKNVISPEIPFIKERAVQSSGTVEGPAVSREDYLLTVERIESAEHLTPAFASGRPG